MEDYDEDSGSREAQLHRNSTAADLFKEDWAESIVYKKAMKAEAIKRGLPYEDFECDDDAEAYELTTVQMDRDDPDLENAQDANITPHAIGFLKKFNEKGGIRMLSENEVAYTKTLLKQEAENWENKSTLADLYRHCKFTIRMLTRKMAGIDNKLLFKKNRAPTRAGTLVMVYRAESLYAAKGDANRIFLHLARCVLDTTRFEGI